MKLKWQPHGNGHPMKLYSKLQNSQIGLTGLHTLRGMGFFVCVAVLQISSSSYSSSDGPPMAKGVDSYNHRWWAGRVEPGNFPNITPTLGDSATHTLRDSAYIAYTLGKTFRSAV